MLWDLLISNIFLEHVNQGFSGKPVISQPANSPGVLGFSSRMILAYKK